MQALSRLDAAGHHRLTIEGAIARLESEAEHRHSDLRWALLSQLSIGGRTLDPVTRSVEIAGDQIDQIEVLLAGRPLTALSPFETRYLADNLRPHPETGRREALPQLITDLHTHFAGCPHPQDLIAIGVAAGARYPRALLERAGIRANRDLSLAELPPELAARLADRLAVPCDRQLTFREMQEIYRLRQPITKLDATFIPMARQIARDYAAMGVRYVELSLHQIVQSSLLERAHAELPRIEAETGVKLRFLAAFGRQDDREWMLDYLDRVVAVAGSEYIVGIDVMGHEVNSTREFAPVLGEFARRIEAVRPGFVVRVHAGENAAFPENVRVAAECVRGADVQLRIGHGLYGSDRAVLELLAEIGAMVEFNLDSNFALNNLQTFAPEAVPLVRYLDAGVPVVLGTDGYGTYRVTLEDEARAATWCGLGVAQLARIRSAEERYLAQREERERATRARGFVVPADPDPGGLRYGPATEEKKRSLIAERDAALLSRLGLIGAPVLDRDGVERLLRGKRVISFAGAWRYSWEKIAPPERAAIQRTIEALLEAWDPVRTVLLTGGTRHGLEALVQRAARHRGYMILGVLVKAIPADDLEPSSITHAHLIGESIYDKAGGLYRLVKDHDGWCIFIGGGPTVGDEIQTADNLCVRHLLMAGVPGASALHAAEQPERAFLSAEDALARMAAHRSTGALRYLGPNPAVDVVVLRGAEVLLIRRRDDARAFAGAWALPGGFVKSHAPPGARWIAGVETIRDAAVREVREETGLDLQADRSSAMRGQQGAERVALGLSLLSDRMVLIGEREGGGRDPRDTDEAWVRSLALTIQIGGALAESPIAGSDDAGDARWWPLAALPALAFDHAEIIRAASSHGT